MIPGTQRFPSEMDAAFSRICIAAAWPAIRPGFVVVVGEHKIERVLSKPTVLVLDEYCDERLWHVVEGLEALRRYYKPERVVADAKHVAAMQFVQEHRPDGLAVEHSSLCLLDGSFAYALPILQEMLAVGRLIVPATAKMAGELLVPPRYEDPARLRLTDYPAVTALAFAVCELEQSRDTAQRRTPTHVDCGGRILR